MNIKNFIFAGEGNDEGPVLIKTGFDLSHNTAGHPGAVRAGCNKLRSVIKHGS